MLQITTDFESGNIGRWVADGTRRLRFEAPTDGAAWAMWFYFRLDGAEAGDFEFVITNLAKCLEATHWGDVRPLIRAPGGEWLRARDEDVTLDPEAGEFSFRFALPGGPVEVAYCYPYPPAMAQALLAHLSQHPGVEVSYPGHSAAGRPIPYVMMRCTHPQYMPQIIWAQSREHAGEVSGAYTLDGLLRALVTSPLRERFEIHTLPMVDIDAVAEGRYGKVAPPIDHHVCWTPDTPRPEVRLGMELMRASVADGKRFRLFLNFHSPSAENDSYLPPFNPTLLTPSQQVDAERLFNALASSSPAKFPFTVDDMAYQRVAAWYGDDIEHRADAFLLREFGAESCLVETAYHASPTGMPASPTLYRQLGASIVTGLEKYLADLSPGRIGIYDSMPPIFRKSSGWVLWRVPRFTRLSFSPDHALAVADDPSAEVYFGAPRLYPLDEISGIRVRYLAGGVVEVIWCCYDERGTRLLAKPQAQTLVPNLEYQTLKLPDDLPTATRLARPGFQLSGAFRHFEVTL